MSPKEGYYREARQTIKVALEWLDSVESGQKFFLWVHLFDPHIPLRLPERHYKQLMESSESGQLVEFWTRRHHIPGDFYKNQKHMLRMITRYDAEVRYVDTQLQRLFRHYRRSGFDQKSLWVITSDHGEGLGNHSWWGHGKHIYNEQLHLPLVFYFSSGLGRGLKIDHLVENVDIFPTLFELLRGDVYPESIEGESLLSFMIPRQSATYRKSHAFSQRRAYAGKAPESVDSKMIDYEDGEKYALQSRDYKYIYRTAGPDEFYDLRSDPYEVENLIDSQPGEAKRLRDFLLEKLARLRSSAPSRPVDKKAIEQLKSLGYVQ